MTAQQPQWVSRLLDTYQAGVAHSFILHFNTGDYVSAEAPVRLVSYLSQLLVKKDIIAIYSRDRGIDFPTETMRQAALDALGMSQNQSQPNAALSALQSIGAAPATPQDFPRSPDAALQVLDKLLRVKTTIKTAIIIENAELIIPDAPLATMSPEDRTALATVSRWGRDPEIVTSGNPVILITGNLSSLHSELRTASNRYEAIQMTLPDTDTRRVFLKRYLDSPKREIKLAKGLNINKVANATAGLSLLHIEDILLRAESTGKLTQNLIWERKEDIIRSEFGDVLEIIEPRFGFCDVGGLEHVKRFFDRSVIRPIQEDRKGRVPMGVLLTGPAGTGKSIVAEAIAKEAGVNAVRLRIGGQIASKWQGEGERNLEKALRAIEGLAPTIVFIDEIDQAVQRGNGSGSNQQDQRIFQRLLEFMSDTGHRGEIVFLAATNRPDLMDAALRRPGRFDKKIPFLVPDADERKAIFAVMARRYLGQDCETSAEAIEVTEGWTGAEIEAVVVKAAELVEDEKLDSCEAIDQAVKRLSPSTADIQLMTLLAIQECNDADLLPPKYKEMLSNRTELNQKIEQVRDSGDYRSRREL